MYIPYKKFNSYFMPNYFDILEISPTISKNCGGCMERKFSPTYLDKKSKKYPAISCQYTCCFNENEDD